jgi:transcriptional regulator with XRE-family HTH domain
MLQSISDFPNLRDSEKSKHPLHTKKYMERKKVMASHRIQLAWNQETMAEYLGVGRVLLSLAEIGERELPPSANIKLLYLIQTFEQARQIKLSDEILEQEKEEIRIALQKEWEEVNFQWHKQKKVLEKLERDYKNAVLQRQFFEYLDQNPDALEANEKMKAILASQSKASLRHWQKNLKAQVLLLQIKIEGLELQKKLLEEKLG